MSEFAVLADQVNLTLQADVVTLPQMLEQFLVVASKSVNVLPIKQKNWGRCALSRKALSAHCRCSTFSSLLVWSLTVQNLLNSTACLLAFMPVLWQLFPMHQLILSVAWPVLQLGGHAGTGQQTANRAGAQAQDLGNRAGQQAQRAGDQAGQTARNAQAQAGQTGRTVQHQAGQAAQGIQQQAYQALDAAQPYIEQAKQVASEYGAVAADKARELGSIAQAQGGDTLRLAGNHMSLVFSCWCLPCLTAQVYACVQVCVRAE